MKAVLLALLSVLVCNAQDARKLGAEDAIRLATSYSHEQYKDRGTSGSELDYKRVATSYDADHEEWIVHIPERRPTAKPSGRTVAVHARTRACRPFPVE
jgi:hypothetical protein